MVSKSKYPLFSILVANYNNGRFFIDCYHSIIEQTYSHWEVIIVDDGSTDNSVAQIKDIIGDDNRFKLFEENKNRGCGFAKRKCAEVATGEILGFLDPDDALYKSALEVMVSAHVAYPKVSIASSRLNKYDADLVFVENGNYGSALPTGKSFLTCGLGAITAFASFKRDAYLKTEGIDFKLKRAIDQDLYFKLEEQGDHHFIDKYLYKYRQHSEGISQNENKFKSEYWRFIAVKNAFIRRKKLGNRASNFSNDAFRCLKSNYYISRLIRATKQKRYCIKYYFLILAISASPMHKWRYKLKAFLLYYY